MKYVFMVRIFFFFWRNTIYNYITYINIYKYIGV